MTSSDNRMQFNRLHELYNLLRFNYHNPAQVYSEYLKKGLEIFGLSLGVISKVEQDTYTILAIHPEIKGWNVGDKLALKNTYCDTVIRASEVVSFDHIGLHPTMKLHPAYLESLLECYIAAPIWVNNKIYGTLNFTSKKPKKTPFTPADHEFINLMAQGIGFMVEQMLLNQEKERAVHSMLESYALFEIVFENAAIGMALVFPDGHWCTVNQPLVKLFGYEREELLSLDFQSVTHPDDLALDLSHLKELVAGKISSYQMEKRYLTKKNKYIWALLSVSVIRNDDGTVKYFVSQIQNINDSKEAEKKLKQQQNKLTEVNTKLARQAAEDSLTGIANRRKFVEWFDEESVRVKEHLHPVSLAIIDIDSFKSYNDAFGHLEGDEALRQVAKLLKNNIRKQDKLARFGGEEFILMLPETNVEGSLLICERLRKNVADLESLARKLTISIGCVTFFPNDKELALDTMIYHADKCLYEVKNKGKNQIHHQVLK